LPAAARRERDGRGVLVHRRGKRRAVEWHVAPDAGAVDADRHDAIACAAQRGMDRRGGAQRDLVLRGAAAEQQSDGDGRVGDGFGGERERELVGEQWASFRGLAACRVAGSPFEGR